MCVHNCKAVVEKLHLFAHKIDFPVVTNMLRARRSGGCLNNTVNEKKTKKTTQSLLLNVNETGCVFCFLSLVQFETKAGICHCPPNVTSSSIITTCGYSVDISGK